jgi:hypothetical protein
MSTKINEEEIIVFPFELTNECICQDYNEETESFTSSSDCYGDCFNDQLDYFTMATKELFDNSETSWWKVSNLKIWDGNHSGLFYAESIEQLVEGMTVRSGWIMRGSVYKNKIEYSLSHHDAPMGSNTVLTMVSEEQREKLGLY